jgi:hypothetical protein
VCYVSLIEPYHIVSNQIQEAPDLDAIVTDNHELGYDVEGYEYKLGHALEEIVGSQCNKARKKASYLVNWNVYSHQTDWTEEPYEKLQKSKVPREFHVQNPQVPMYKRLYVEVVPFLLGDIVVPRDFNSKQRTGGFGHCYGTNLRVCQCQKKEDRIDDNLVEEGSGISPLGTGTVPESLDITR